MTKEEYIELISSDKQIQVLGAISGTWKDVEWNEINPDQARNVYRPKPEPQYRKFEAVELLEKMVKFNSLLYMDGDGKGMLHEIYALNHELVFVRRTDGSDTYEITYQELFENYKRDGKPMGVEVNNAD